MATIVQALKGPTTRESPQSSIKFDRLMIILVCWFVCGLFIDGWAHNHGLVDRTFFTPWHALLYSGYAANAAFLTFTFVRNHLRGQRWSEAIPDGYQLALLGAPIFAIAGVGDLIWHTLFGFEVGIEPLLSPTHLLLAFSAVLIMSGPLRAAMRRDIPVESQNWTTLLPGILSMTAVLSVFTFFTSFVNPFVQTWTLQTTFDDGKELGIASVLLLAGILMGFVLVVLRRWKLPVGTLTLVFTINVALMGVFKDNYPLIPVATLAGLIADFLIWWLQPSTTRPEALRLFAFSVPVIFYLCYFVPIILTIGITWKIHLWLGSCVMAGLIGLGLSYLMVPPRSAVTPAET
ncbi:MAG TPA: hypothetical protein VEL72_06540 [Ktedonobacteraceae bacterium]|nr:hypothetical protein [Ktedonobacteraceae bacterium]